jgi:hypothetical protein
MKVGDRVRCELAKAPATAFELAVSLGWAQELGNRAGMRLASAWCANFLWLGEVKHAGQVRVGTRLSYLYELTEKGRSKLPLNRN